MKMAAGSAKQKYAPKNANCTSEVWRSLIDMMRRNAASRVSFMLFANPQSRKRSETRKNGIPYDREI